MMVLTPFPLFPFFLLSLCFVYGIGLLNTIQWEHSAGTYYYLRDFLFVVIQLKIKRICSVGIFILEFSYYLGLLYELEAAQPFTSTKVNSQLCFYDWKSTKTCKLYWLIANQTKYIGFFKSFWMKFRSYLFIPKLSFLLRSL